LKLKYDILLLNVAFKFDLRRCIKGGAESVMDLVRAEVRRCRLTLSNPR